MMDKKLKKLVDDVNAAYAAEDGYALTWSIREIQNKFGAQIALRCLPGEYFIAQERWVDEETYKYTVVIDREYEIDIFEYEE